jgi:hypothetical protein
VEKGRPSGIQHGLGPPAAGLLITTDPKNEADLPPENWSSPDVRLGPTRGLAQLLGGQVTPLVVHLVAVLLRKRVFALGRISHAAVGGWGALAGTLSLDALKFACAPHNLPFVSYDL